MKKVLFLLLCCSATSLAIAQQTYPNLRLEPAQPKPDEKITLTYDPTGTPLADAPEPEGVVHMIKPGGLPFTLSLKREGKVWKAELPTTDSTSLMLFTFGGTNIRDNNNGQGYALYTYTPEGKPSAGARGWLGFFYGFTDTEITRRDMDKAIALFEEEFKDYPASKEEFLRFFLKALQQARPDDYPARAQAEYAALAARENLTPNQLALLVAGYQELNQPELAAKYLALLREKAPQHPVLQVMHFRQITDEQAPEKKAAMLKQFRKDFPPGEMLIALSLDVAQAYRQHARFADLRQFVRDYDQYLNATACNDIAWRMYEASQDLGLAETLAAAAVAKARQERGAAGPDSPAAAKKAGLLGQVLDTYGAILDKRGQPEKAYTALKESVALLGSSSAEVNEKYVSVLVKTNRHKEALAEGDKFIPEGKGTRKMKEDLRKAYMAVNGSEKGFDLYLASLEAPAREKLKEELRKQMISQPAPAFSLRDLKGNTVALADLKGKTVVVDFWATWCGPCVSSMPAMQQTVNKYKGNPDVKFLFINSWQKEPDKQKVVSEFLQKKKFDFTVPLDTDNQVITAYGVEGIPTKFVIDPQGNIRFRSTGFSGGPDGLVEELSMMIDLAAGKEQ